MDRPFVACVSSERRWEGMDMYIVHLLAKHTQNRGGGRGRACELGVAGGWGKLKWFTITWRGACDVNNYLLGGWVKKYQFKLLSSIFSRLPLSHQLHGGRAGGLSEAGHWLGPPGDRPGLWEPHHQVWFRCLRVQQRGSAGSAQACYKAGGSSNLGSAAPHGGSADGCEVTDMGLSKCLWMNEWCMNVSSV